MIETDAGGPVFCILFLLHLLFHTANFSWMFVEGKRRNITEQAPPNEIQLEGAFKYILGGDVIVGQL